LYTIEIVDGKMYLIMDDKKLSGIPDQLKNVVSPRMELKGSKVELENVTIQVINSETGRGQNIKIEVKDKVESYLQRAVPKQPEPKPKAAPVPVYPFNEENMLYSMQTEKVDVKHKNYLGPKILNDYPICSKTMVLVKSGLVVLRKYVELDKRGLYVSFNQTEIDSLISDLEIEFYKYIIVDARKLGKDKQLYMSNEVTNVICLSTLEGNSSYNITKNYNESVKEEIKARRELD
jgi:hypothetical protein